MKKLILLLSILSATHLTTAQTIEKSSIDSGGASASAGNIEVLYTIGEVNVQELSSSTVSVSEGFISASQVVIKINPAIFLQGPYMAGSLTDGLRAGGILPTTSPYTDALICNASVFNTTGTN